MYVATVLLLFTPIILSSWAQFGIGALQSTLDLLRSGCNLNVGIPVCENPEGPTASGFDTSPCGGNSYLSVGTICFNSGLDQTVKCIDALGTAAAALPSATSVNFLPSTSPVPEDDVNLKFGPENAWNVTTGINCTASNIVHNTAVQNATISFNYTGNSILINTIMSPLGGVFSVAFDGVLLMDTIDTFNAGGELCFHRQYPPFEDPPVDLGSTNEHSITLVYIGPSDQAPKNSSSTMVQFNSFEIPQFKVSGACGVVSDALLIAMFIFLTQIQVFV
ncbi:hypothetical protein GALMADRAFT_215497 [Galerina marginata CBS 339.88]|uniref:Uncharacterized protein n=1 Tax=Galerina marginata (strain CBS 339.88) TaxID=685588 RepID=A0A067SDC5_GALM3|nr:hypothetical protein GALMADRAFT_215497 [Galerina marginata CBS 339.88]